MPDLPTEFSPQGTTVSFNGTLIGYLTDFDWQGGAGEIVETTSFNATVVGTGDNARVVKSYDCTSVEPLVLNLQFWGPPSFEQSDGGLKATLEFSCPGAAFEGPAILRTFTHTGVVGQWTTGTASFQISGDP